MENQVFICALCDGMFQLTDDIHDELCMDCCNTAFGQYEEYKISGIGDYIPELEVIRLNKEKK